MSVMKLNEIEIEGIKNKFRDGFSLEDIQGIMPNNKKNLIADLYDELTETKEIEKTWDSVFEECAARLISGGVSEGQTNAILDKARTDIDLASEVPDTEKLYIHCIMNYNKQDMTKMRTESGKQHIHAMNAAAASSKTPTPVPNKALEANIFRPKNG